MVSTWKEGGDNVACTLPGRKSLANLSISPDGFWFPITYLQEFGRKSSLPEMRALKQCTVFLDSFAEATAESLVE